MKNEPKLPIGIQSFEDLRKRGCLYIDKTALIYDLVDSGKYYFLSRPRRFGKSLLLSTIKAIFSGKKDLFKDLWISTSNHKWEHYPVLHFDMSMPMDNSLKSLTEKIEQEIHLKAKEYFLEIDKTKSTDHQLKEFFSQASAKVNKMVVLIDEYDNPINTFLDNHPELTKIQEFLRKFYSNFKTLDEYIHCFFVTGITKFAKTTIFSGLNQLNDISLNNEYATLLGYTQKELEFNFSNLLKKVAEVNVIDIDSLLEKIRRWYNGYQFSFFNIEKVYNPFSILLFFYNRGEFKKYWFDTGNPSFLYQLMQKRNIMIEDIEGITITEESLSIFDPQELPTEPLMFQSGYLTISSFDSKTQSLRLDFPNNEVRSSFITYYLKWLVPNDDAVLHNLIIQANEALLSHSLNDFIQIMKTFFLCIPYPLHITGSEKYYHSLFFVFVAMLGIRSNTGTEIFTSRGRIDMFIETPKLICLFEFKMNKSPAFALKQIHNRKYYEKFLNRGKRIVLVGLNFSDKKRNISSWKMEEIIFNNDEIQFQII